MILAYCFQHSANIVLADLREYSQKISTAKEKIAQIHLQYRHVFPSLDDHLNGSCVGPSCFSTNEVLQNLRSDSAMLVGKLKEGGR